MDTTAVSGISSAGQTTHVSAPSPVATVRPPARASSSGAHDPSSARQERRTADRKPDTRRAEDRTDEARRTDQAGRSDEAQRPEQTQQHEPYQSLSERIAQETELRIDRDSETGRIIFQTIRSSTGEVLRQVPSEQMVSLAKSIREAQGLLIDREA